MTCEAVPANSLMEARRLGACRSIAANQIMQLFVVTVGTALIASSPSAAFFISFNEPNAMARETKSRLPLPKRFSAALSDKAYGRLRSLNVEYGLGNNYLLTVLLENLDDISTPARLRKVFERFISEYGAPDAGVGMSKGKGRE